MTIRSIRGALTLLLSMLSTATLAQSSQEQAREEAALACEDAAALLRDDDIDGALAEARWCLESLQQLQQERTLAIFPDSVDGWMGGELEQQGVMGMTVLTRRYTGDAGSIDLSLTSGAAGAGLAAIAQLGLAMGTGTGRKLRIRKRTVLDTGTSDDEGSSFLVQLRSGGMLNVESADAGDEAVLQFLRAFPIEQIDDALKR